MRFDIDELYAIYGKKSIANALREYIQGSSNSNPIPLKAEKSKADAFYDEPTMVPSTFFVAFKVEVLLDLKAIAEDYNDIPYKDDAERDSYTEPAAQEPDMEPEEIPAVQEEEIPAADVSKLAQQAMAKPQRVSKRKGKVIDLHAFFQSVFRKKLSAYAVSNKIRDLQRAGLFAETLGDFTIESVTCTRDNDFTWLSFNTAAKGKIIRTGYSLTIESKTKQPATQEDIEPIAQGIVPIVEKNVFVDTVYYKFLIPGAPKKKIPTNEPEPELPEQPL